MSANEIDNIVIVFPDPGSLNPGDTLTVERVPAYLSYAQKVASSIQTLSTNDADPSGLIKGLLYVPDLSPTDPCVNLSGPYIPKTATRQVNLPITDFNLVALAPWINSACTNSFLNAATMDPIRAFIFYLPGNSTEEPPPINSQTWNMNDGGKWKAAHHYPVYAVPGSIGAQMMSQLALYSGNVTTVPYGNDLLKLGVGSQDFVRIYTEISLGSTSSSPGLWVFLLVVLAALAVVFGLTSFSMHYIQRTRRNALRRRVARGDVDLEALGIKRLKVPEDIINKMPLFMYTCKGEDEVTTQLFKVTNIVAQTNISYTSPPREETHHQSEYHPEHQSEQTGEFESTTRSSILAHDYTPQSQPVCAICLEDFVSGETTIRELPCSHIFHPECIDSFLRNNSSLCPLCKKSVLPLGYCPREITNAMVRRERMIRQIRSRVAEPDDGIASFWRSINRHVISRQSRAVQGNIELQPQQPNGYDTGIPRHNSTVQERGRDILGVQVIDPDMEEQRMPKWRKAVAHVFPGF